MWACVRLFSNVWSENTALFERLMEIHSNSPKLYYGFKMELDVEQHAVSYLTYIFMLQRMQILGLGYTTFKISLQILISLSVMI